MREEVVSIARDQIPELFGSINTARMEFFDDIYAKLSEAVAVVATVDVVAAGIGIRRAFLYQDFNNTNPLIFDGVRDPIIAMRWLSGIDGCFFTCSCPTD